MRKHENHVSPGVGGGRIRVTLSGAAVRGIFWMLLSAGVLSAGENIFHRADRLYRNGRYQDALQAYRVALQQYPHLGKNSLLISAKIGMCFYRTGQYRRASRIFELASREASAIQDFLRFFHIKSRFLAEPGRMPVGDLRNFEARFPQSPLTVVADSLLGEYYYRFGVWDSAAIFYRKVLSRSGQPSGKTYFRLFQVSLLRRDTTAAEKYARNVLQKVPGDTLALQALQWLRARFEQTGKESLFKDMVDYLLRQKRLREVEGLLNRYAALRGKTDFYQFQRLRWLYRSGRYGEVIRMASRKERYFRHPKYYRDADLYLARAYLRSGQRRRSIEVYLHFQRRYPGDKLAPEVLWKAAWLSEEEFRFERAQRVYRLLAERYPRSSFGPEARFREGLIAYRKTAYRKARRLWEHHLNRETHPDSRMRLKYWIAKTYLKEGDFLTYWERLGELAERPFQTYYNLKAFLLTRDGRGLHRRIDSILWNSHRSQLSLLPEYLESMERFVLIREIFGARYFDLEYRFVLRRGNADWKFWYALGELQERLGNYGSAFRLFRRVFFRQFAGRNWEEVLFIFKRLYPLYYFDLVHQNAARWGLSPALILAIMKKESAFETRITSYANAYGLMQLIPPTARQVSRQLGQTLKDNLQLFDPARNILLGSYYFRSLMRRFQGNLYYALAAYNAGPGRVDRWSKVLSTEDDDFFMENIEFEQTRRYVRVVMQFYWTYSLLLFPGKTPEELLLFPENIINQTETRSSGRLE